MKRALYFLRLVDPHDGLISLTNLALIVVIFKLVKVQNASVVDLGTFFVAVLGYNAKKWLAPDKITASPGVPTP